MALNNRKKDDATPKKTKTKNFFLVFLHFFCKKICQFRKKLYLCTRKRKKRFAEIKTVR